MKKGVLLLLALCISGCTKIPDRLYSPTAVIKAELRGSEIFYTVYLKGDIINDQTELVLKKIRGTVALKNSDQTVISLPFELPELLPLQKQTINAETGGNEREMAPIFALLRISPDQLRVDDQEAYTEEMPLSQKLIAFEITAYESANIFDIIEGK